MNYLFYAFVCAYLWFWLYRAVIAFKTMYRPKKKVIVVNIHTLIERVSIDEVMIEKILADILLKSIKNAQVEL
jgi:hypothetical protein